MNTITLAIIIVLLIGNIYSFIKYYKRRERKRRYRRGYLESQNSFKHRKNKRKHKQKLQENDLSYNAKADVTALSKSFATLTESLMKLDKKQDLYQNEINRLSSIMDTLYNRMDKLEVDVTFIKDHTIKKEESSPIVFEDIEKYQDALKETKENLTKNLINMLHKKEKYTIADNGENLVGKEVDEYEEQFKPIAEKPTKSKKKKKSKIFTDEEIDAEMRLRLGEILFLSPKEIKREQTKAYQRLWYKHSKNKPKKNKLKSK